MQGHLDARYVLGAAPQGNTRTHTLLPLKDGNPPPPLPPLPPPHPASAAVPSIPPSQNFYYAAACSAVHPDDKLVECVSGGPWAAGGRPRGGPPAARGVWPGAGPHSPS